MKLALDTNRYTDLCRGNHSVIETVERADEVWLPFVVLGELRAGLAVGSQGPRNEAVLRRFLLKPGVGVLYADEQTTHHYAAVYRQLRKQGLPFPPTICGSLLSSCNIPLSCSPRMRISKPSLSSRVCSLRASAVNRPDLTAPTPHPPEFRCRSLRCLSCHKSRPCNRRGSP